MKVFSIDAFAYAALTFSSTIGASTVGRFSYDDQAAWPDFPAPTGTGNQCARENASGVGQSPIDIATTRTCGSRTEGYSFFEGNCVLDDYKFSINDHGLKAEIIGTECTKPTMTSPGTDTAYEVLQFHIHTGCEHTFDGQGCDAELHIVHAAKAALTPWALQHDPLPDLAVVGIMLNGGNSYHDYLDPLLDSWASISCSNGDCDAGLFSAHDRKSFAPYSLLPSGTNFYSYAGSLTTPPCWEVVNWSVAERAMDVSWRQILAISNLVNNYKGYRDTSGKCFNDTTVTSAAGLSGRATQPLAGRQVEKICAPYSLSVGSLTSPVDISNVEEEAHNNSTDGENENIEETSTSDERVFDPSMPEEEVIDVSSAGSAGDSVRSSVNSACSTIKFCSLSTLAAAVTLGNILLL